MAIDRMKLNDAISTMLVEMSVSMSDDQLDELTHQTADYIDAVEADDDDMNLEIDLGRPDGF